MIRKKQAAPAREVLVNALKRLTSPHVRIALVEALSHVGESALALAAFRQVLASRSESISLQTLDAMTHIDTVASNFDPSRPLLAPRG